MIPESPHDLYRADDAWYLIPTGTELPPGVARIVAVDGQPIQTDAHTLAPYRVTAEQAQAFHEHALADATERVSQALGGIGHLLTSLGAGEPTPRPTSLDRALHASDLPDDAPPLTALLPELSVLMARVAQDPAAFDQISRQVAAQWEGVGSGTAAQAVDALRQALQDRVSPDDS